MIRALESAATALAMFAASNSTAAPGSTGQQAATTAWNAAAPPIGAAGAGLRRGGGDRPARFDIAFDAALGSAGWAMIIFGIGAMGWALRRVGGDAGRRARPATFRIAPHRAKGRG